MAIYRSDQAQFSFAAEAADGAMPEQLTLINIGSTATQIGITVDSVAYYPAKAGDQEISVENVAAFIASAALNPVAVYACINNAAVAANGAPEIVRVTGTSVVTGAGTLFLATPLARDHKTGASVTPATSSNGDGATTALGRVNGPMGPINTGTGFPSGRNIGSTATNPSRSYITWIPGVYDTVDAPDLEEAYEERFFLADNTRRNPFMLFKGTQSFEGAVAGMVLLNGWPLRFAFGGIDSWPIDAAGAYEATTVASVKVSGTKGDTRCILRGAAGDNISEGDTLILNAGAYTTPSYNTTGLPDGAEIVTVKKQQHTTNLADGHWIEFNQPLIYDHGPGHATSTYSNIGGQDVAVIALSAPTTTHFLRHIYASTRLPSMTWNINVRDEDGVNDFQRRYYGGKLGAMTITAEEGGLVLCDWDSVQFLGMVHNQYVDTRSNPTTSVDVGHGMRRYHPMLNISKDDLGIPNSNGTAIMPSGLPATQPYYFSEGEIKFFGRTVARLRSFSLSITNALEPRYYVRDSHNDDRGPFEIKEGQRTYSMTATVGLPDSTSSDDSNGHHSIFRELMMSGNYSQSDAWDGSANATGMTGFDITITFKRANDEKDYIKLIIPEGGTSATSPATGGPNKQGAFIVNAPINIDNNNPMEQNVNIMFSNMRIEIKEPRSNGGQYP